MAQKQNIETALEPLETLAWPKENAVAQCKRLMKQVTDLITIYELKTEDFL
jgi:hypothetical protein